MSMDNIIEVFYHLNKMLIANKHIDTSCTQPCPNLSTSLFPTYDHNSPDVIDEPH